MPDSCNNQLHAPCVASEHKSFIRLLPTKMHPTRLARCKQVLYEAFAKIPPAIDDKVPFAKHTCTTDADPGYSSPHNPLAYYMW